MRRTLEQKVRSTERELLKAQIRGIYSTDKPDPKNEPLFGVFGMHGIKVSDLVKNRNLSVNLDHRCAEDLMHKASIYTMYSLLQFSSEDLKTLSIREYDSIAPCLKSLTHDYARSQDVRADLRLGMTHEEIERFCRNTPATFQRKLPDFRTKAESVDAQGERVDIRSDMLDIPRGYTAFKFSVPGFQQRFLRRCHQAIKRLEEQGIDPMTLLPPDYARTYFEPDIKPISHYDKASGDKIYPVIMNYSALHILKAIAAQHPNIITNIANDKEIQSLERRELAQSSGSHPETIVREVKHNKMLARNRQRDAFKAAQVEAKWGHTPSHHGSKR